MQVNLKPATRRLLREAIPQTPCTCGKGCIHDIVQFRPICHEDQPLRAHYSQEGGALLLTCSVCGRPAACFQIAEEGPEGYMWTLQVADESEPS